MYTSLRSSSRSLFLSALAVSIGCLTAAEDVVFEDFEGADYGLWTTTSLAFGSAPVTVSDSLISSGSLAGWDNKILDGYSAAGLGNGEKGILVSPDFVITHDYIQFLIGGGGGTGRARMRLLDADTNTQLKISTGSRSNRLDFKAWDVSSYIGKSVRIEIEDKQTGGWGHMLVDDIIFSDNAERQIHGVLSTETWSGISAYDVSNLVMDNAFFGEPNDQRLTTSSFFGIGKYSGGRVRGYLTAPDTGYYTFWLSASTAGELWLSSDDTKYRKQILSDFGGDTGTGSRGIAYNDGNLWDMYSAQMSEEVYLEAGQTYFLEMLTQQHHVRSGRHVSVAWARPGLDRELIPSAYLKSYVQEADDTDDDYLPDSWESLYGLDTTDNGLTDRTHEGDRGDFDTDGLSNREEYVLGTDPSNADTDGDGLSDLDEVKYYKTDPNTSSELTEQIINEINLENYASSSADWRYFDGGLIADNFRSAIEWQFDVPSDGWWLLDLGARLRGILRDEEILSIKLAVDGQEFGYEELRFLHGNESSFKVITPWLTAGTHSLSLHIDNYVGRRTLQLMHLRVMSPQGLDVNQNGIADWLESKAYETNTIAPHSGDSFVSPAFVEGTSRYSGSVAVSSSGSLLDLSSGVTMLHWYANMPLDPDTTTSYGVSFENGAFNLSDEVNWKSWDVLSDSPQSLRVGDQMKFYTSGAADLEIEGVSYHLNDSYVIHTFSELGVHSMNVSQDTVTVRNVEFTVFGADFGSPDAFYADRPSWREFTDVSDKLFVNTSADLRISERGVVNDGQLLNLMTSRPDLHKLEARLAPSGAVVSSGVINAIGYADAVANDAAVFVGYTEDGYKVLRSPIVVTFLPEGATVRVTISRAGVSFLDGTRRKFFNAEDFNNGVLYMDFRYPKTMSGGYCHYIDIYDAEGNHIGRH